MAFELAAINPTSVPINLLIPRAGTKFGERELMDPWEAVKWVAIFRLILPEALFRLCGGRIENLGELHGLAVRAGLNGVMMGNFLTALGDPARGGPRDVRGARPEHRPPARQRLQPAPGQPLRLARRRDARRDREFLPARGIEPRPRRRPPSPPMEARPASGPWSWASVSGIPRRSCASAPARVHTLGRERRASRGTPQA